MKGFSNFDDFGGMGGGTSKSVSTSTIIKYINYIEMENKLQLPKLQFETLMAQRIQK